MLIILIFKRFAYLVLIIMAIKGLIYQYNGRNFSFFYQFTHSRECLGKILEMFPYSVTGFLFASSGIIKSLKRVNIQVVIASIYLIYFICNYNAISNISGYGYTGLKLYFISIGIFICFAMFPSEKIKNNNVIKLIKILTKHTAGIYYCHIIVHQYTKDYIKPIENKTIKGCIIIYLICYLICFIGSFFFGKTIFRHLFE